MRKRARLFMGVTAGGAWTAAWTLPWQEWVAAPGLRTGSAWLGLALPGVCWAALLGGDGPDRGVRSLAFGPALSLALIGVVGAIGGAVGAPAVSLEVALFGVGLAGVCGLAARHGTPRAAGVRRPDAALALVVVVAAALLAAWWARAPATGSDNYTYLAQIVSAAKGDRLPFELVLAPDRPLSPARFWLAAWPLAQAWLAGAARVDPLALSTLYADPWVAAWSVLAVYVLGRALHLTPLLASAGAVAQLVSCAVLLARDQPGFMFFTRLNEDKSLAAFVLAPLLFASAATLPERRDRRAIVLCLFTGLAMVCTHPPIFGAAAVVVLLYGVLDALATHRVAGLAWLAAILVGLAALPFSFRFGSAPMWQAVAFTAGDLARRGGGDPLLRTRLAAHAGGYAVALPLVSGAPFVMALVAGVVGLARWRRGAANRLVAAAVAVVGATLVPHSAALLALGVTYIQLWRLPWLTPFGIAAAVLIEAAAAGRRRRAPWAMPSAIAAAQIAVLLVVAASAPAAARAARESARAAAAGGADVLHLQLASHGPVGPLRPSACRRAFTDLAAIGAELDRRIDGTALALGDRETNDLLPALSRKVRVAIHRNAAFLADGSGIPRAEVDARMRAWAALMAPATTSGERRAALRDLQVEYLLVCDAPAWSAALHREAAVHPIARAGNLTLFQVARETPR